MSRVRAVVSDSPASAALPPSRLPPPVSRLHPSNRAADCDTGLLKRLCIFLTRVFFCSLARMLAGFVQQFVEAFHRRTFAVLGLTPPSLVFIVHFSSSSEATDTHREAEANRRG